MFAQIFPLSCFLFAVLISANILRINLEPKTNKILAELSFPASEALQHTEELKRVCEQFRKVQPSEEAVSEIHGASFLILRDKYIEIIKGKDAKKKFDQLMALEWDVFKSIQPQSSVFRLQELAYYLNKVDLIKHIYIRFQENFQKFRDFNGYKNEEYSVNPEQLKNAELFIEDYKARPEVHEKLKQELFKVPASSFEETVAFCSKQFMTRIDIMKRTINILREMSSEDNHLRVTKMNNAMQTQVLIGPATAMLHDMLAIKFSDTKRRESDVTNLLNNLMNSLGTFDYGIQGGPLAKYLEGHEPFSLEWMYLKFRLIPFAAQSMIDKLDNSISKHLPFLQSQDTLLFLVVCQVITALRPLASKLGKAGLPYLVFDPSKDRSCTLENQLAECMNQEFSKLFRSLLLNPQSKPNADKLFFEQTLPRTYSKCLNRLSAYRFMPLSAADLASLQFTPKPKPKKWKPKKSTPSEKQTPKIESPDTANEFDVVKEKVEEPIIDMVPLKEQNIDKVADLEGNTVGAEKTAEVSTVDEKKIAEVVEEDPLQRTESLASIPVQVELEYDQEEADKWTEIYYSQLAYYAQKTNGLQEVSTEELGSHSSKVAPLPDTIDKQASFVAKWSTNDFLQLFPDAKMLYHYNLNAETAHRAAHDRTLRFRWIFDPQVIIDAKTFKFLCQVFGLLPGRKTLTFLNFQKAFLAITGGSPGEAGSKNRTVFCFRHSFVVDGMTCIPPIRGVHPEHLSSGFNHIQVRGFLENGGAHPYFFQVIDQ